MAAGIFSGSLVEEALGGSGARMPVPSASQLQRTATALVDLAIASVNLDSAEGAVSTPWGLDGADIPANNADDTTALVAFVQAEPVAREEAQDDLLGSFGVLAGSSSTGRLPSGRSPVASLRDSLPAYAKDLPEESESLARRAQQQCRGTALPLRGRAGLAAARGTAQGRSFSAGAVYHHTAAAAGENAFRNGEGTLSPMVPLLPGGRALGPGGHDPHCELRTEECVIS